MQRTTSAFLPSFFVQSSRLRQGTWVLLQHGAQFCAFVIDFFYASKVRLPGCRMSYESEMELHAKWELWSHLDEIDTSEVSL